MIRGVRAGIDDEFRSPVDVVARTIPSALGIDAEPRANRGERSRTCFAASFFGVERARSFSALSAEGQAAFCVRSSEALLTEAFFIEKMGVAFGAKMILSSENSEERMLYAAFNADEARHLYFFDGFFTTSPNGSSAHPFHTLLKTMIEEATPRSLVFLVQVVLEGWGLSHYKKMRDATVDDRLRTGLTEILRDEARHHGTGCALFSHRGLSRAEFAESAEILAAFLGLVQMGPVVVVDVLAALHGGLTESQRREIMRDLNAETHVRERLSVIRGLMERASAHEMISHLTDRGAFVATTFSGSSREHASRGVSI